MFDACGVNVDQIETSWSSAVVKLTNILTRRDMRRVCNVVVLRLLPQPPC